MPDGDNPPLPRRARETTPGGRPRRHRLRWCLVAAAALLLLAVALLPQILSLGPCRRYALGHLTRRLGVRVSAADWSLSWFGDQAVERVEVRSQRDPHGTAEGRPAARLRRVTLRQGLASLLLDRSRIGPVGLDGGEVWADRLEAALAVQTPPGAAGPEAPPAEARPDRPAPPPEDEAPEAPPTPAEPAETGPGPAPTLPESVDVTDLVIHAGGGRLRVRKAAFGPDEGRAQQDPHGHAFEADLGVIHGKQEGACTVKGTLAGLAADWQGPGRIGVEAVLSCTDLPLAPLAAVGGAAPAVQVTGTVTGETTLSRSREGRLALKTNLQGTGLEASGPPLGTDRPALQTLTLTAEVSYDAGAVTVSRLALDSAVGTARASGTFALAARKDPNGIRTEAPPVGKGTARLEVDLARLAAMLPDTLNLHKDLAVESGTFVASADAASDAAASRLHLVADVTALGGTRGGPKETRMGQAVALSPLHLETDLVRPFSDDPFTARARMDGSHGHPPAGAGDAEAEPPADTAPPAKPADETADETAAGPPPEPSADEADDETDDDSPGDDSATVPPTPPWLALAESVQVKTFRLTGGFGTVEATGRLNRLVLDAELDLARATEEAGRFADLGGYGGAGTAEVHLETVRDGADEVSGSVSGTFTDLVLNLPDGVRLREPEAVLSARASLAFDERRRPVAVDVTDLALEARTATLTADGALRRTGQTWAFEGRATGGGTVANLAGVGAAVLPKVWAGEAGDAASTPPASITAAAPRAGRGSGPSDPSQQQGRESSAAAEEASPAAEAPRTPQPAWRRDLVAGLRRAAGADGPAAQGTWTLTLEAGGTMGRALAVKTEGSVSGLVVPPDDEDGTPLRLQDASLTADGLYAPGEARQVTVNTLALAASGVGLTVEGPTTVTIQGSATTINRPATVTATADLSALAALLRPLGYLPRRDPNGPADPAMAGDATVTLTLTPSAEGPTKAALAARVEGLDLAWSDGRGHTDPLPRLAATVHLIRSETGPDGPRTGPVRAVEVTEWSLATAAGSLKGTARGERAEAGPDPAAPRWLWNADARGEGPIGPVAHTAARLLSQRDPNRGAAPSPLEGVWNLTATYTGRSQRDPHGQTAVEVDLSATGLTIPREAPAADVSLDDVHLRAHAAVGAEGQIRIDRASVTGPGLSAEAEGTVRLPTRESPRPRADGRVEAAVNLARLARVLRPFGVLGKGDRLSGGAALAAEVRTDPTGLGGSGTVTLTELAVHLAEAGSAFREAEARLPIVFAYVNQKKRWEVAATDMSAVTARGSWRVAVEPAEPASADPKGPPPNGRPAAGRPARRVDLACDLAFDGRRVREALGQALPETLRLSGPYRVRVRLAGPLPAEGPWHRRLAAMEGDGHVRVGGFTYVTLTGGEGTVRWDLADGALRLSPVQAPLGPDPDEPSRSQGGPNGLTLAGGTVTPAGRIDLTGEVPHLVIAERARVVEGLPLAGEQVREFLKYLSPVLAASVGASGRLTLDVESLDLPLAEDARDRAVGDLAYHIDEFQTQLMGPLGRLVEAAAAEPRSITQTLGPVRVRLRDGVFHVPEHDLRYTETVSLRFGGRIGLDKRMNVIVGVPVTRALMERHNVSERAMPYLEDVVLAVPLGGTIDEPEIDQKALAKRLGELALEAIKRETLKRLGDWLKR